MHHSREWQILSPFSVFRNPEFKIQILLSQNHLYEFVHSNVDNLTSTNFTISLSIFVSNIHPSAGEWSLFCPLLHYKFFPRAIRSNRSRMGW